MEFQGGLMKLLIHKKDAAESEKVTQKQHRWRISFHRSSSSIPTKTQKKQQQQSLTPPNEFLCPISLSLMADPVIVSSGHTFERACAQACQNLNFIPILPDKSKPDFTNLIPNLALKATILNWCHKLSVNPPKKIDFATAQNMVRALMTSQGRKPKTQKKNEPPNTICVSEKELIQGLKEKPPLSLTHAVTDITRPKTHFRSSSDDSTVSTPPLQLSTRPSCYSSPSSSEIETVNHNPNTSEEEEIITKLKSPQVFDIEEAVISLRNVARTREDSRAHLCTPRLLLALRPLITSKYTNIQVNTVAALVNLSLEKKNKVKIVRSGFVPPLIDVLKGGSSEAQEHACGTLFSLSLADENKTAIGVLGALQPLLHLLRSENERTRHDSALALYHLTLVQSNRTKIVKLGSVPVLLGMVKSGYMTGRVLLVLCNLGSGAEGRSAMLDAGAVECVVEMLRGSELGSVSTRESCVAVLYALSHGGLRFQALAKAAGLAEVLWKVEKNGSERAKEKARRMLEMIRGRDEEEEEVDWEELIDSGFNRSRGRSGIDESRVNSSEF